MSVHQFAPEVLYADTTAKQRAYTDLSKRCAAAGDAYRAVHAAWAADVNTVQAVMWERVMVASPIPEAQFDAIADTIASALANHSTMPAAATDARAAVTSARDGLAAAFDAPAQRVIAAKYAPLDHLDGLPHPTADDGLRVLQTRTHGDPVETVIARKRHTAQACMVAAQQLRSEGQIDEAMQQAWQADWATFEAYLMEVALQVGDTNLVTVDMRWALAADLFAAIPSLPSDFVVAVGMVRDRLKQSLGSIEGERLAEQFEFIL